MEWLRKNKRKTMLGQLLIEENLLSESQLARAIERQKSTGQRLGDAIADLDLISKKQVAAVLRKQRTVRFMASIVTALLGPVPVVTAAAAPVAPIVAQAHKVTQTQHSQRTVLKTKNHLSVSTAGLEVVEHGSNSSFDEWSKTLAQSAEQDPWDTPLAGRDIRFTKKEALKASKTALEGANATWLGGSPTQEREAALQAIEHHHSRVANTIRNLWGHRECCEYINKLIMDGSNTQGQARMGFHQSAVEAMLKLIDLHEQQFPELAMTPVGFGITAGVGHFPMSRATPV